MYCCSLIFFVFFFFQAEDGIRDAQESRGLGDVYKRQLEGCVCEREIYGRMNSVVRTFLTKWCMHQPKQILTVFKSNSPKYNFVSNTSTHFICWLFSLSCGTFPFVILMLFGKQSTAFATSNLRTSLATLASVPLE
eukprot:TRINITY_DN8283_c0_g1_i1.p1 TRINITY_DN8283_c0_g1~~TRINITY_DN8283_c0_g1_i1.p1  ORF type:complete len:136 (-),score=5.84 TRINITY_DN8283_c0_g1_i1:94-501(-)